jgi:hypothetical protein
MPSQKRDAVCLEEKQDLQGGIASEEQKENNRESNSHAPSEERSTRESSISCEVKASRKRTREGLIGKLEDTS